MFKLIYILADFRLPKKKIRHFLRIPVCLTGLHVDLQVIHDDFQLFFTLHCSWCVSKYNYFFCYSTAHQNRFLVVISCNFLSWYVNQLLVIDNCNQGQVEYATSLCQGILAFILSC